MSVRMRVGEEGGRGGGVLVCVMDNTISCNSTNYRIAKPGPSVK